MPLQIIIDRLQRALLSDSLVIRHPVEADASAPALPSEDLAEALSQAQMMVCDLDGAIRLWSEGCARLYGYAAAEAIGRNMHELLATRFPCPLPEIEAALLRDGHWAGEIIHRRRDGSPVIVAADWRLRRDSSGHPVSVLRGGSDVTALRVAKTRLRLAQEAGGVMSWEWDVASGAISWAEGGRSVLGLDERPGPGSLGSFMDMVHPEDRERLRREIDRALANKTLFETEFRVPRPDGKVGWLAARGEVERDERGRPVLMRGATYDVTRRREAEDALARLNAEMEARVAERTAALAAEAREHVATQTQLVQSQSQLVQSQKMEGIGHLVGGIAHDFNNLLAVVLGNLELLRKRLPDDPAARQLLGGTVEAAERGAALTRRLLGFARRQEPRAEAADLRALVAGMSDLLARALPPAIRIDLDLAGDLPSVRIDANQMELALLNLAVNARDAMPEGGTLSISAGAVRVEAEDAAGLAPGAYACLTVRDSGTGMDAATLARATEPFFTTKDAGKGTGLGLSMVHGLMRQMGGALALESRPGEGTIARMWLPRAEPCADVPPSGEGEEAAAPSPPAASGRGLRLLLVDDDPLLRGSMSALLQDLGHEVVEAASGEQALGSVRDGARVDAVITDLSMPGMNGVQLAARLREARPDLPVLLATGHSELPDGVDTTLPCLWKPFRQADLVRALEAVTA